MKALLIKQALIQIKQENDKLFYDSYLIIRRSIGILGILLPILLILGGLVSPDRSIESSLSAYYHNNLGDVFVLILGAAALLLIAYRGNKTGVRILTTAGGIMAMFVILFPTKMDGVPIPYGVFLIPPGPSWFLHNVFALSFFSILSVISFVHFTKHIEGTPDSRIKKNKWYKLFGIIIFISALLYGVFIFLFPGYPVLIAETVGLEAIGATWLIKGWKKQE